MRIDEAGRHDQIARVQGAPRGARDLANLDDARRP
jgi:hypothetical protein